MKTYFKSILLYTMLLLSALSVKAKSTSERMSNMEVLSWNNCLTLPSFNSMPNKGIAGAFFGFSMIGWSWQVEQTSPIPYLGKEEQNSGTKLHILNRQVLLIKNG